MSCDARPHVLLVEDDPDTREMYSHYLNYSGMRVTAAPTGMRALESARVHRPDVVVTDIAMPGMDGYELSQRLRAEQLTQDLPIIAVSGQVDATTPVPGANVVLEKPCEPERLVREIQRVLRAPSRASRN
jgi:adenylate cyclase